MKRVYVYPMTLLFLVASYLAFVGKPTLVCAQEEKRSEAKPGLSLAVLVDTSAHQKNVIQFEREAINLIADTFSDTTEAFVARYADEVELLHDWSPIQSLIAVSPRIELDTDSGTNRRTLLFEALNTALTKLGTASSTDSKVLIVIGEGNNAGGQIKYSEVKKQAKYAHVQCFVLLVADHNLMGGRVRHYGFDLYDLVSATKGKAYDIEHSRKNLDRAITDVLKRVH